MKVGLPPPEESLPGDGGEGTLDEGVIRLNVQNQRAVNELAAQLVRGAKLQAAFQGADWRDARIAELEGEAMERKMTQAIEGVRSEVRTSIAEVKALVGSRPPPGNDGHSFVKDTVELAKFLRGEVPTPSGYMKDVLEMTKSVGAIDLNRLEALKLDARLRLHELDRLDAKEAAASRAVAEREDRERGREELRSLLDLGRETIREAVSPITKSIGDGLAHRIGTSAAPPRDPRTMTSVERGESRQRITAAVAAAHEYLRALDLADREAPPAPPSPGPESISHPRPGEGSAVRVAAPPDYPNPSPTAEQPSQGDEAA